MAELDLTVPSWVDAVVRGDFSITAVYARVAPRTLGLSRMAPLTTAEYLEELLKITRTDAYATDLVGFFFWTAPILEFLSVRVLRSMSRDERPGDCYVADP